MLVVESEPVGARPSRRHRSEPDGRRFEPVEACQFAWSDEVVLTCGVTVTVTVAHTRLCHSRMPFVRACPRETREPRHRARTVVIVAKGCAACNSFADDTEAIASMTSRSWATVSTWHRR